MRGRTHELLGVAPLAAVAMSRARRLRQVFGIAFASPLTRRKPKRASAAVVDDGEVSAHRRETAHVDGGGYGFQWIPSDMHMDSSCATIGIMKTTVDIPDEELEAVMRFTRAATKREAIVTAIADYNRRRRMAALLEHAGKAESLVTPEELQAQRRQG